MRGGAYSHSKILTQAIHTRRSDFKCNNVLKCFPAFETLYIWWESLDGGSVRRKTSTSTRQHNAEEREHMLVERVSNPNSM